MVGVSCICISTCATVLIVRFYYMIVNEHPLACYGTARIEKLRSLSLRITKNLITYQLLSVLCNQLEINFWGASYSF